MKNINKILALLLIGLLTISNVQAEGFPEEPMVIYGNIIGNNLDNKKLRIIDGKNKLLKEVIISNKKYGTEKTLDINNKILLLPFTGNLQFQIDGYDLLLVSKGFGSTCEKDPLFQKGNICKYNLQFQQKNISSGSGGGGGGGGGGTYKKSVHTKTKKSSNTIKNKSSNTKIKLDETKKSPNTIKNKNSNTKIKLDETKKSPNTIKNKNSNTKIKLDETKKISSFKRNNEGKIIIKGIDNIKAVKKFHLKTKETKTVLGYKVLNIKGDKSYNKIVEKYTKKIHKDIKLNGIRKKLISDMNSITKTFGILSDSSLNNELKTVYTIKLKEDIKHFKLKIKLLKIKAEIIKNKIKKLKKGS